MSSSGKGPASEERTRTVSVALFTALIWILQVMFAVGAAGAAVVLVLTFIEDLRIMMGVD
jgi:hypothetical protein